MTKSDFKEFVDHPVLIYHALWTSATSIFTINDLIANYLFTIAGTPMANKLANLSYVHCKIRIKIVVQGQPFAAGQIVFSFTPYVGMNQYAQTTDGVVTNNKVNCKVVPHLIVDPSKTQSYEVDLPVCTPNNFYSIKSYNNFGSYTMDAIPFNPLFSGTATAASAGLCVYMSLVDPVFEGLTFLSNEFENEKKGGLLSNFARGVGKYSPLLSVVFPEAAPGITLFSKVSNVIGDALSYLGFSKPQIVDNTTFVLNRFVDNYSQFDGTSTALVLGGSQSTTLGIGPGLVGYKPEEMSLAHIRTIKGLIRQVDISPSFANGQYIDGFPVDPTLTIQPSLLKWWPTPLGGSCTPFGYWTGDLEYTFEFVASVFHRATVLIAWDPNMNLGAPPTLASALQVLQNVTVYISGNTSVKVTIPWKQALPWSQVSAVHLDNGVGPTECNGAIYVYVVNPVTSNGSTDGVQYNVYISSSNMLTAFPEPSKILSSVADSQAVTFLSAEFTPVTDVSFGPKTDLSFSELKSFGESYNSVKQLTSKLGQYFGYNQTVDNTWTAPYLEVAIVNFPRSIFFADKGNYQTWTSENLFTYFARAYLGYRGGVRYKFHVADVSGNQPDDIVHQHYWSRNDMATASSYVVSGDDFYTSTTVPFDSQTCYAFTQGNRELSPNLDVVCPMIMPVDFVATRIRTATYGNYAFFDVPITIPPSIDGAHHVNVTVCSASADDGQFVWFLGFPGLNLN